MVHAISLHLVLRYTSPYFTILQLKSELGNWDHWDLSLCGQILHIKPVVPCYALPWHALSSPGAWFPASQDRATKPRSSALARLHLGTSHGNPGCLPSSSMIFALDLNWIPRKFSINLIYLNIKSSGLHENPFPLLNRSQMKPNFLVLNLLFWMPGGWVCFKSSQHYENLKGYRVKMGGWPLSKNMGRHEQKHNFLWSWNAINCGKPNGQNRKHKAIYPLE